MVIKLLLHQIVQSEQRIWGIIVDALMNSDAKLQLEFKLKMFLYIQEEMGWEWRTWNISIKEEQATCGQEIDASISPSSKEKI